MSNLPGPGRTLDRGFTIAGRALDRFMDRTEDRLKEVKKGWRKSFGKRSPWHGLSTVEEGAADDGGFESSGGLTAIDKGRSSFGELPATLVSMDGEFVRNSITDWIRAILFVLETRKRLPPSLVHLAENIDDISFEDRVTTMERFLPELGLKWCDTFICTQVHRIADSDYVPSDVDLVKVQQLNNQRQIFQCSESHHRLQWDERIREHWCTQCYLSKLKA